MLPPLGGEEILLLVLELLLRMLLLFLVGEGEVFLILLLFRTGALFLIVGEVFLVEGVFLIVRVFC